MKVDRQKVFDKSGGLCWYCGCGLLSTKGMHIDHFEPLLRNWYGKGKHKGCDDLQNLVPACPPCNLFKSGLKVKDFRLELEKQVDRARASSVNFRNAEKFNLIKVESDYVEFWYEKNYFMGDRNFFVNHPTAIISMEEQQ